VTYFSMNPIAFPMGSISLVVTQDQVVTSIASLLAASFVAGLIPSVKAARENILKAIWGG